MLAAASEKAAAHRLNLPHSTVKHHRRQRAIERSIDQARIERQIRELALDHAAGRLEDGAYLGRLHELRDAKADLERTSADPYPS